MRPSYDDKQRGARLVQCERCGLWFYSTKRGADRVTPEGELFVCVVCEDIAAKAGA